MSVITQFLEQSISIKQALLTDGNFIKAFEQAAALLQVTAERGGTIYIAGNGGSACDAMHFSEELVARYKRERPGIRAMHFLDPSAMSCWSNDYAYESYFKRQVETFCTPKDCFVAISTSGNSQNLVQAVEACRERSVPTIGLLGKDGGALNALTSAPIIVPDQATDRIQEVHILIIHAFCELLETE